MGWLIAWFKRLRERAFDRRECARAVNVELDELKLRLVEDADGFNREAEAKPVHIPVTRPPDPPMGPIPLASELIASGREPEEVAELILLGHARRN